MLKQADQLQNRPQVSGFARKGNYVLEKVRGEIDSNLMDQMTTDPSKVQMNLLNDYLNSYSEKLARAGADDPNKINIDKTDFY